MAQDGGRQAGGDAAIDRRRRGRETAKAARPIDVEFRV